VEYNELPLELARATNDQGELLYGYSNPGLFLWSREFARAQALREDLPFHKAYKKIPHLSPEGQLIEPQSPCGYKFESFAMDTLPDAERSLVLSCDRDAEFAPVKNAEGTDSPASARALMNKLFSSWVQQAGGTIENPAAQIEISPLYALDAQQVKERLPKDFTVKDDLFLGEMSEI
jgi:UDP-N-acetylglucosamine/UDP-N-acetylgalactosamine diphosphorylase